MKVKLLNLNPVYDAIQAFYSGSRIPPPLPERDDPAYHAYRDSYKRLLMSVDPTTGVYLWFSSRARERVEYIYVGESHTPRRGLEGRFDDEFKRMYHGFWATLFRIDKYLGEAIVIFGDRTKYTPRKSYDQDIRNDFERRGASHLVYCTGFPDDQDLVAIQNDLIQLFNNPRGNVKDRRDIPSPDDQLSGVAKTVFIEFQKAVESAVRVNGSQT